MCSLQRTDELDRMKIGTKSILFGAHQFLIHPLFVAFAWWRLYGFPWDPRLWVCFFIHDLGYWGKPNMDGPEGEAHVHWGADVVLSWFGFGWSALCRFHSRTTARDWGAEPSRLCWPDKLAFNLEPWWLYLPRVRLTGELEEYMEGAAQQGHKHNEWMDNQSFDSAREWRSIVVDVYNKQIAENVKGCKYAGSQ